MQGGGRGAMHRGDQQRGRHGGRHLGLQRLATRCQELLSRPPQPGEKL